MKTRLQLLEDVYGLGMHFLNTPIVHDDFPVLRARFDIALRAVERADPGPTIVCLCGSTRFMDAFFEAGWEFTLQGKIVLSVGVCKHVDADGGHGAEALGQDVADRLDELHKRKIDLADEVFVLNVGGYIGDSTRSEIEYATEIGKPIQYLEDVADQQKGDTP